VKYVKYTLMLRTCQNSSKQKKQKNPSPSKSNVSFENCTPHNENIQKPITMEIEILLGKNH